MSGCLASKARHVEHGLVDRTHPECASVAYFCSLTGDSFADHGV